MAGFFDRQTAVVIAHRGGGKEAPENSMAAFRRSIKLGIDHIELDVQATADGQVYVRHGSKVNRLVHSKPFDLVKARRGGYKPLLFEEVLKGLTAAKFYVDIKNSYAVQPVAKMIAEADAAERTCISSFNRTSTLKCGKLIKELSGQNADMALLVRPPKHLGLQLKTVRRRGFTAVAVLGKSLSPAFIKRTHQNGLKVVVWTVNEPERLQRLAARGVDAVGTDCPSKFAKY